MPNPEVTPAVLSRRQALVGALTIVGATAVLTACSSSGSSDASTADPDVVVSGSPDPTLLDEQALIARYDATIAAYPALATALTAIRDQHAEHITALGGTSPTAPSAPAGGSVAPTAKAAVGALVDAERTAMRARLAACVEAPTPERARVLAYIAASEGSHIPALGKVDA